MEEKEEPVNGCKYVRGCAVMSEAMRSFHAPKARITQKNTFVG